MLRGIFCTNLDTKYTFNPDAKKPENINTTNSALQAQMPNFEQTITCTSLNISEVVEVVAKHE